MLNDTDPTDNERLFDMLPETSIERAKTYELKDPERTYQLICGDDRELTTESADALAQDEETPVETFIRYYGGLPGETRVLITTLIAQGREDLVEQYFSGSFVEAIKKVKADVEAAKGNNVSLDVHSAIDNEEGLDHFNPVSEKGLGCAYAANIATISTLCAENEDLEALTRQEGVAMGSTGSVVDTVKQANRTFANKFFPPGSAGMSRQDFVDIGAPVAILEGSHADPEETVAVLNFTRNQVSNPKKANEIGKPFYNNDVTQIAEMLIRAYPEFDLNPKIMFAVIDQDIRATRAALAGGNASAIKQERLGDPREAIAYLKELQESLA